MNKKQRKNYRIRIASLIVYILLLLLTIGAGTQAVLSYFEMNRFSPEGKLYAFDGYMMHLFCTGSGSPTILLESDFGYPAKQWYLVQRQLAQNYKVCSYDRAGMGWSDARPQSRTGELMTQGLYKLVQKANINNPIIIVGYKQGTLITRLFAYYYPNLIKGVVLIDPTDFGNEIQESKSRREGIFSIKNFYPIMPGFTWLGMTRLLAKTQLFSDFTEPIQYISIDARDEILALTIYRPQYWAETAKEYNSIASLRQEIDSRTNLLDTPLVIINNPNLNNQYHAESSYIQATDNQELRIEALKISSNNLILECISCGSMPLITAPSAIDEAIRKAVEFTIP